MLRPPSFSRGFTSFVWAVLFGLFVWAFLLGIGVGGASAFLFGLVVGGASFFFIRLFGGDEYRPRRRERG